MIYLPAGSFQTFDQLLDFPDLHVPIRRAGVVRHLSAAIASAPERREKRRANHMRWTHQLTNWPLFMVLSDRLIYDQTRWTVYLSKLAARCPLRHLASTGSWTDRKGKTLTGLCLSVQSAGETRPTVYQALASTLFLSNATYFPRVPLETIWRPTAAF